MFESWFGAWRVVQDGQAGLLSRDGVYERTLGPGRHRVGTRQELVLVATARQAIVVAGQEVLSRDGFLPKLGAIVDFTVADARLAVLGQVTSYLVSLQWEVALALRTLAAGRAAEDLATTDRAALDAELLATVRPVAARIGLDVEAVRLRDVTLPADLRRLITGVEKARREGQAALERAHAEQASLRALANAARMLRNNPELQNLRLLQAIGTTGAPTTIVLGTPAGIVPVREGAPE